MTTDQRLLLIAHEQEDRNLAGQGSDGAQTPDTLEERQAAFDAELGEAL